MGNHIFAFGYIHVQESDADTRRMEQEVRDYAEKKEFTILAIFYAHPADRLQYDAYKTMAAALNTRSAFILTPSISHLGPIDRMFPDARRTLESQGKTRFIDISVGYRPSRIRRVVDQ